MTRINTASIFTFDAAQQLEAAHERYVVAMRRLNSLRIAARGGCTDYVAELSRAHEQLARALNDWRALFDNLSGRQPVTRCLR